MEHERRRPLHVAYSFPHAVGRPGIGVVAFHNVVELARAGAAVTLFCTSVHRTLPPSVAVHTTLTLRGRRIAHRLLGVERSYRFHDRRVARALGRLVHRPDVVHCWPKATVETARAARELGIPTLREVTNTHTAHAFEAVAREAAAIGVPLAAGHSHTFDAAALDREEAEYDAADLLLMPSDYARKTFLDRGFTPEKLVLHRYGYDPSSYSDQARSAAERPFTALFVARGEPRKGLHHALRAWIDSDAAARGGRFLVFGTLDPAYRAVLEPMLADPSVELHGFVDRLPEVMRSGDVLVLPSLEEGSALVTYEARGAGCVLAVSDAVGARCRHGVDALVHRAGDVAELTEHLRLLARDPATLARLRSASMATLDELTWEAAARELLAIYGRAAGRA